MPGFPFVDPKVTKSFKNIYGELHTTRGTISDNQSVPIQEFDSTLDNFDPYFAQALKLHAEDAFIIPLEFFVNHYEGFLLNRTPSDSLIGRPKLAQQDYLKFKQ